MDIIIIVLAILIGIPIALIVAWNILKFIGVIILDAGNLIAALIIATVLIIVVSNLI